ncbi:MAG TPA: DUF86 domain-containing protein [Phycisphaerales bacterium]|nr:DUF86 domain-containing protein [Phycisphaerales bacterium]
MKVNGGISGKLKNLDTVLSRLRSLGAVNEQQLEDWVLHSAIERSLQVAVEIVIDICHRLNSLSGRSPAASARDAVEGCVKLGVLSSTDTLSHMIGFRNLVVHRYEHVETQILIDIVNNHLDDFDDFRAKVLDYVSS